MAFADTEKSLTSAAPRELFKFIGNYNTYRFTSFGKQIVNSEGTYLKETIKRSAIEMGTQEEEFSLVIELPFNNPMVVEYAFQTSPPSLVLEMYRAHPDDLNDTLLQWTGQVTSWSVKDQIAKLKVPSLLSYALAAPLPWVKYQAPCNNFLYDTRCKVLTAGNESIRTIIAISENMIELDSSPFLDGETDAGEMIFTAGGERRMIISNIGVDFTIKSPFAGLSVSDTVTIRKGCDHAFNGDCINRFANGMNFGGFPLVPNKNPFKERL